MELIIKLPTFAPVNAEIAQLVEHNLAKVRVASSSLVFRSSLKGCSNGGIGRHEGLKIPWPVRLCGFKSRFEYESIVVIPCKLIAYEGFLFIDVTILFSATTILSAVFQPIK